MENENLTVDEVLEDPSTEFVEVVAEVVAEDYTFLDKPFEEYTTSEALLLLIFIFVFLDFILNILRRWF